MQQERTRKLTMMAMLSALAYLVMLVGRIPIAPIVPAVAFLKYDPKDVIIMLSGLIFGPVSACAVSVVVSFVEMITVSETGWIGCIMNIISTCSFVCPAAVIYKKNRSIKGAVIGLIIGVFTMTIVMLLWNYFLTPIYKGWPRQAVADLLIPGFLPFNLIKGGLNAAVTMLIYKPVINALRSQRIMPLQDSASIETGKAGINKGLLLLAGFILLTCALFILVLRNKI